MGKKASTEPLQWSSPGPMMNIPMTQQGIMPPQWNQNQGPMINPPLNTEQQSGMMAPQRNQIQDARANEESESNFRKVLLKGEPKVLGAIQLIIVFIHIALGTILIRWDWYVTYSSYYGINLWGIPFFLASGILSVVIENNSNPSFSLVRSFMSMNIVSAIESGGTIIVFCLDMYLSEYNSDTFSLIIIVYLFLTNLLQFSISVSLATFGRHAMAIMSTSAQQASPGMFVIPNPYINSMASSATPEPYGNLNLYLQLEDDRQSQNANYRFPNVSASHLDVNRFQPPPSPPQDYEYPVMGLTQSGLRRNPTLSQDYQTGSDSRMYSRNPTSNMPYN